MTTDELKQQIIQAQAREAVFWTRVEEQEKIMSPLQQEWAKAHRELQHLKQKLSILAEIEEEQKDTCHTGNQ